MGYKRRRRRHRLRPKATAESAQWQRQRAKTALINTPLSSRGPRRTSQCTPTLQLGARRRCRHTRLDTNVGPASLAKRTQPTGTVRPQGLEQQPRSARKREKLKTHAVLQDGWRREPLKHVQGAASASSAGKACNPQAWRPKHCKWQPKPRQVYGNLETRILH